MLKVIDILEFTLEGRRIIFWPDYVSPERLEDSEFLFTKAHSTLKICACRMKNIQWKKLNEIPQSAQAVVVFSDKEAAFETQTVTHRLIPGSGVLFPVSELGRLKNTDIEFPIIEVYQNGLS